MARSWRVVLLAAALVVAAPPAAGAATFTVTRTDDVTPDGCATNGCTLREAIVAANANAGADFVDLGNSLHYTLSRAGINENAAATGDLDITGPLTIDGSHATVDAAGIDRVFEVFVGADTTFKSLTITGGSSAGDGGGIEVVGQSGPTSSPVVLDQVMLVGNHADEYGGGINTNYFRPLVVTKSTIASNTAGAYGAGAFLWDVASFTDTWIHDNVADDRGGGIARRSPATDALMLTRVALDRNSGTIGGGLYAENGGVTATDVEFGANAATALGVSGGAIFSGFVGVGETGLKLTNATIAGNTSAGEAGGVTVQSATLTNVTLTGNSAAVPPSALAAIGSVNVRNSIVDGGCGLLDAGSSITSDGHDLESGTSCGFFAPGDRRGINPRLGPLAGAGSVRVGSLLADTELPFAPLLSGSPALELGNAATCPAADVRGLLRPQGGACDSGAYEAGYTDLAVTGSAVPTSTTAGANVTFAITVTNASPRPADGVVLEQVLPAGATVVSTTAGATPCGGTTCALGTLVPGAAVTVTLVASAPAGGAFTDHAAVRADTPDAIPANDATDVTVQQTLPVTLPGVGTLPGPPPRPSPDTVRPKVTIKLGAISRSKVARARVLQLRVTLSEPASVTLRALRVRKRTATSGIALGRKTLKATKAGTQTVRIVLSRRAAAALRRTGTATLLVTAAARDAAGNTGTAKGRATLRR
jgi:uncharacterized repeat protein (TIGR01451 family)/CSLREA domain-containing protein